MSCGWIRGIEQAGRGEEEAGRKVASCPWQPIAVVAPLLPMALLCCSPLPPGAFLWVLAHFDMNRMREDWKQWTKENINGSASLASILQVMSCPTHVPLLLCPLVAILTSLVSSTGVPRPGGPNSCAGNDRNLRRVYAKQLATGGGTQATIVRSATP